MIFSKAINNKYKGLRLDIFLAEKYTYLSRTAWRKRLKDGSVKLNNRIAKPASIIQEDSTVEYTLDDFTEKEVNTDYSILYQDKWITAINKPANIPVHTSGTYFNNTLIKLLRKDFKDPELSLINRLDRETSGIILVSSDANTRSAMGIQFQDRKVKKEYIAYVFGSIKKDKFSINQGIGEIFDSEIRIKSGINNIDGAPALTNFERLDFNNEFSEVLCKPITGRTSQIRIHLTSINHPIVGDKIHSGNDKDFLEFIETGWTKELESRLLMDRQALHAHKLRVFHPGLNKEIEFHAPVPKDMLEFKDKYF